MNKLVMLLLENSCNLSLTTQVSYIWAIVALAFLLAEMLIPGLFFFISFAIGAAIAAITAGFGTTLTIQCLVGLSSSIGAFLLIQHYLTKNKMSHTQFDSDTTNIGALIGASATVTRKIPEHGVGDVKVGGEVWSAAAVDSMEIATQTLVKIIRVEGNKLIVQVRDNTTKNHKGAGK